jgi:hypothetical protein
MFHIYSTLYNKSYISGYLKSSESGIVLGTSALITLCIEGLIYKLILNLVLKNRLLTKINSNKRLIFCSFLFQNRGMVLLLSR